MPLAIQKMMQHFLSTGTFLGRDLTNGNTLAVLLCLAGNPLNEFNKVCRGAMQAVFGPVVAPDKPLVDLEGILVDNEVIIDIRKFSNSYTNSFAFSFTNDLLNTVSNMDPAVTSRIAGGCWTQVQLGPSKLASYQNRRFTRDFINGAARAGAARFSSETGQVLVLKGSYNEKSFAASINMLRKKRPDEVEKKDDDGEPYKDMRTTVQLLQRNANNLGHDLGGYALDMLEGHIPSKLKAIRVGGKRVYGLVARFDSVDKDARSVLGLPAQHNVHGTPNLAALLADANAATRSKRRRSDVYDAPPMAAANLRSRLTLAVTAAAAADADPWIATVTAFLLPFGRNVDLAREALLAAEPGTPLRVVVGMLPASETDVALRAAVGLVHQVSDANYTGTAQKDLAKAMAAFMVRRDHVLPVAAVLLGRDVTWPDVLRLCCCIPLWVDATGGEFALRECSQCLTWDGADAEQYVCLAPLDKHDCCSKLGPLRVKGNRGAKGNTANYGPGHHFQGPGLQPAERAKAHTTLLFENLAFAKAQAALSAINAELRTRTDKTGKFLFSRHDASKWKHQQMLPLQHNPMALLRWPAQAMATAASIVEYACTNERAGARVARLSLVSRRFMPVDDSAGDTGASESDSDDAAPPPAGGGAAPLALPAPPPLAPPAPPLLDHPFADWDSE